jgi:hypothetical protein
MPVVPKALALAGVALSLVSASPAIDDERTFAEHPSVRMVTCKEGSGSAVQIAGQWISVAHVTAMHDCEIDGQPIAVLEQNGAEDFSRLIVASNRHVPIKISCAGMRPGQFVWAYGYAMGLPFQTRVTMRVTEAFGDNGQRELIGAYTVIPGMSGGLVMNARGEAVGVVNAYRPFSGLSFSRDLRQTSLCQNIA